MFLKGYIENPYAVMYYESMSLLYPGDSAYESQVGGALTNLRNSTTLDKIKKYIKSNMCNDFNVV